MKLQGFKCKHCGTDDLVLIDQPCGAPVYIYHYSIDYELGCHQRINLLHMKEDGIVEKELDEWW
jgi:hypothetical protein